MRFLFTFFLALLITAQAQAQSVRLLFDAETMAYLEEIAEPIAEKMRLNPQDIDFRLIVDDEVNAFVTPDRKIYFNSGLFIKATRPEHVLGVVAHELGHLKAQHHFRIKSEVEQARVPLIIAGVLGVGAAIAGAGTAGAAIISGSQAGVVSNLLSYSRAHEVEADKIALKGLNDAGYSAEGMAEFFDTLTTNRLLYHRTPPPYLTTHPLSETRRASIQYHIDAYEPQVFSTTSPLRMDTRKFKRIQTKIVALTATPASVLRKFNQQTDDNAVYAKAIARARQGKLEDARLMMMPLLEKHPDDLFYAELVAQIYVDRGDAKDALPYFQQIVDAYPGLSLARLQYADALIMAGDLNSAMGHLRRLRLDEPEWPGVHRKLGLVHGKQGKLGESHLALAEEAYLRGNKDDLKLHLRTAKHYLKNPTPEQQQQIKFLEQNKKNL